MKNIKATLFVIVSIWLLTSCTGNKYSHTLWLDDIPYGIIINPYGLPVKNLSQNKDSLEINGVRFQKGIGTQVPSDFTINLDGRPVIFEAITGLNPPNEKSKLHPGKRNRRAFTKNPVNTTELSREESGGAVFKVYADDKLVFTAIHPNERSHSRNVRLRLKNVQNIRLVTEPSGPEGMPVYANWAQARFKFTNIVNPFSLHMFSFPDKILHNQAGYKPMSPKICILPFHRVDSLYVHDYETNEIIYRTTINLHSGDLGRYISADFSGLHTPGRYYLMSGGNKSGQFIIDEDIYRMMLSSHLNYLKAFRESGYGSTPGQLNDASSIANDKKSGSRLKSPSELIHSLSIVLYALSVSYEESQDSIFRKSIADEMLHISRVLSENIRENHSSDNMEDGIMNGNELTAFFIRTAAEARVSRLTGKGITPFPEYDKLKNHFIQLDQSFSENPYIMGAAIIAATELHKSFRDKFSEQRAANYTRQLIDLAIKSDEKPAGFFISSPTQNTGQEHTPSGTPNWPFTALCLYSVSFPGSRIAEECKTAIMNYCEYYLYFFAAKNAFRVIPYSIYARNPGLSRRNGSFFYRYFGLDNEPDNYWRGTNTHLTTTAAGLLMASRILGKPEYLNLAQRQFDWVYGANPFNLSMVNGWGNTNSENCFQPPTNPALYNFPGGVKSGVWGDEFDAPATFPGWPQTCESYLPALAGTLWLTAILDRMD